MIWSALVACVADRSLVEVPVAFASQDPSVALEGGGTVELDEAVVSFSDLRFEEPPLPVARWSPVATAWAHPGHDYPGAVAGELLGAFEVDLLAGATLGDATMYSGRYATSRLTLDPGCARLAGRYVGPDGAEVPFRFAVDGAGDVGGIPFVTTLDPERPLAGVTATFALDHAVAFVDWGADADGDGVLTEADPAFANSLTFGVVSSETWSLDPER